MSAESIIVARKASELPPPHTATGCRMCGHQRGYLARFIKSNASVGIRWVCDRCEDYRTAGDLAHSYIAPIPVDRLPLRVDHSIDPPDMPDCARCGLRSDEFHHWAPSAIFPDWSGMLGAYLCTACHREWHERMRAHGLRWPHELTDAA